MAYMLHKVLTDAALCLLVLVLDSLLQTARWVLLATSLSYGVRLTLSVGAVFQVFEKQLFFYCVGLPF